MFLKTVLADGQAEQTVIREMKARAAGARGDIEQTVRAIMDDVKARGWDAVCEYAKNLIKASRTSSRRNNWTQLMPLVRPR